MKFLLSSLLLLSFIQFSSAQKIDSRLLNNYSETFLEELIQKDIQEYNLLVHAIDNACYVAQAPASKSSELTKTISWTDDTIPSFLDLNRDYGIVLENFNQYILIEGTKNMVVVKSKIVLDNELKTKK
jgi:hypothetical protein